MNTRTNRKCNDNQFGYDIICVLICTKSRKCVAIIELT